MIWRVFETSSSVCSGDDRLLETLARRRGFFSPGDSQTVAEKLFDQGRLGASLFFSQTNGRRDPRRVFPTLAYQFAVQELSYKAYLTRTKLKDPQSLKKAMAKQFRLLIGEPFGRNVVTTNVRVMTPDGLDDQFVLQYSSAPLIWIIASRPETHLKTASSEDNVKPSFWEEDVPVDSPEACRDVEKFLHDKFTQIEHRYFYHTHEMPWLVHSQFLRIATVASGLYIIGDPSIGNPIAQLRCTISIISKVPRFQLRRNTLAVLDPLFEDIISRIPRDLLKVAKDLAASLIFLNHKSVNISSMNLSLICNFLNIARDDVVTALRHRRLVLFFKKVHDIGKSRPHFYHTSFQNFLEDPSQSNEYSIDIKKCRLDLFWGSQVLVGATLCYESSGSHLLSILENTNHRQLLGTRSRYGPLVDRTTYRVPHQVLLCALWEHQIVTYATLLSLGIDKARLMNSATHRDSTRALVELYKLAAS
ncbi:hypothetical protein P691DRAFT_792000 [Macrolepiota fuliginosa MF-IS2]|uniref:Uncharacterized protein n=1 Tax=Macrolepiota fuliginosa MF-IS2 TaxID=1400762 RepID=A0A9P5WZE4_9AGAR|nr:hypothetical protein P691DRAFT_792000 [Macrolepiota fuliginosa MF-IS2]